MYVPIKYYEKSVLIPTDDNVVVEIAAADSLTFVYLLIVCERINENNFVVPGRQAFVDS